MARFMSFLLPRIDDDREVAHGRFDQLLGAMACGGIEEQGVARLHHVAAASMTVADPTREHVEKLDAGMTETGVGNRVCAECNQIRLDPDLTGQRMPEQVIEMARFGAAPVDPQTGAGLDEGAV